MKFSTKFFALLAIVAFTNVAAFADTRIRFAKGRTSATVTGRVAKGGVSATSPVLEPGSGSRQLLAREAVGS